jgi:hypothetical protein
MATQREQILAYLQSYSIAADDDQLAAALGVRRQAINMVCRALAHKGAIVRSYDEQRHILVNRLPATGETAPYAEHPERREAVPPTISGIGPVVTLMSNGAIRAFAYRGEVDLSEDRVKAAVKYVLELEGWTTRVQFGRLHGIDIEATRGSDRLVLEVKGEGSLSAMRVNYFLGALGELLQRMDSPAAHYGLALPAHRQFIGLIVRLPDWVCQRLGLCFYLVRPTSDGLEVGVVPPRLSPAGGPNGEEAPENAPTEGQSS